MNNKKLSVTPSKKKLTKNTKVSKSISSKLDFAEIAQRLFTQNKVYLLISDSKNVYHYASEGFIKEFENYLKFKNIIGKSNRQIFDKKIAQKLVFPNITNKKESVVTESIFEIDNRLKTFLFTKFKLEDPLIPANKAYFATIVSQIETRKNNILDQQIKPTNKKINKLLKEIQSLINTLTKIEEKETKLKIIMSEIEKLSNRDFLTNLYNKSTFEEVATIEIRKAARFKYPICMAILDIDDFKRVNDIHGHIAGDKILKDLSKILVNTVRETDYVCRWGGEEFIVILPNCHIHNARSIAEKIRTNIEEFKFKKSQVTISAGVAEYLNNEKMTSWFIRADEMLLKAKKEGKNKVEIYPTKSQINN